MAQAMMGMNRLRIIVSALLAVAVALAQMSPVFAAMDAAQTHTAAAAADPLHDCCPDDTDPCPHGMIDCASMAACALKCFGFTATVPAMPAAPYAAGSATIAQAAQLGPSGLASPLFRPPRF